ncbi:MAG TPA: oxidoreductase [Lapillicoccus sp.]|uniref:WD40/YVTN/BNR-like repeat-containing protein n=1 Tax=Lapillicoccus sp. TaxID=1909287 RepID=UPI002F9579B8
MTEIRRFRRRLAAAAAAGAVAVGATGSVAVADRGPDTTASGSTDVAVSWVSTPTGSDVRFRGLSAVSGTVAWVGGTGAVLRTTDGGATWVSVGPPDVSGLDLRDVEATSDRHAVILSVGNGTDSRIYVTDDGGGSWTMAFRNEDRAAFYDCMAFSTPQRGLALSDPVDGAFRLQETTDGGHTWSLVDPSGMPPAGANEFAFAASGTCLTAGQNRTTYLASGGEDGPHVLVSQDAGHSWSVTTVPLAKGPAAGTFSVRFRDRSHGIALGGDLGNPTSNLGNAAWSDDGGSTWDRAAVSPSGYRSGSAWLPREADVALAVGPTGSDVTTDAGRTWSSFDTGSFDSVECASDGGCWAAGERGRVARLAVSPR